MVAPGIDANRWARFGGSPVAATRAAEQLRENGDLVEAAAILTEVCRVFPHMPYGWRELGVMRRRAGDADGAAACFQRALSADRSDRFTLTQTVRHLVGMGRLSAARDCLSDLDARTGVDVQRIERLRQLISFIEHHPRASVLALAEALAARPRGLDVGAVETRIAEALGARRPFSLVRLGDGEGAWLSDPGEADGQFRALYRRNRKRILRIWFGTDELIDRPDFLAVRERLLKAISAATVVGITYPARIRHEYAIASLDGVPCCVNVLRYVQSMTHSASPVFCTHDIHLELQLSGALRRLMASGAPIGLISCHQGLAKAISERPGVRVGAALLIPQEQHFAPILGPNGLKAAHFPMVFQQVLTRLRARDWPGTLWLVAAGYLGKIYCHEIACRGGVAVDIGSIADAWSGKVTRPGLTDLRRYSL